MARLSPRVTPRSAVDEIRAMRADGLSVREIGRRTGLGKSTVHDVLTGKYGVSATRAVVVGERVARYDGMLVVADGGVRVVDPATRRNRSLVGRQWRAIDAWRRTGDDRVLAPFRGKSIRLRGGQRLRLETDPSVLRELDDAGQLVPDEILEGNSP